MATSGTYSFNLNALQLIRRAFHTLNVYDLKATIDTDDYLYALDVLNGMLKVWEVEDGIKLWKRKQATLFPQLSQYSYQLGSVSGADNCTNSYVDTTLTANSTTNTIVVSSATGFTTGMYIGIELDTGTRQWTTITNVVGSTITLNTTLTSQASSDNTVVAYTSKINRPLKVLRATTVDLKNNKTEATTMQLSYDEYFNLPIKTTAGRIINYYYDRILNNSLPYTGTLYVYNSPSPVSILLNFTYLDSIQDMVNSSDTADLPQEWLYPIWMNLSAELAIAYGKFTELQAIQPKADSLKNALQNFDSDDASLVILSDNSDPRNY